MFHNLLKLSFVILAVVLLLAQYALAMPTDDDMTVLLRLGYFAPAPPEPELSIDGTTLYNAGAPVVYVNDPNPSRDLVRIPPPFNLLGLPESAAATFSITYVPNGDEDLWGEPCYTFPSQAQAPFDAAAGIWGNIIQSDVPITIRACWANLGSSSILGYSGGGNLYRDFTGAPVAHTWYANSLANALHGSDLNAGSFDMHITYNLNFSWYFGTDGLTPWNQVDLMSVVLHEIAHGLNFSGSMSYSGVSGSWGYGTGYPNIYDTLMRDGSGNQLINTGVYANPSAALGTALTSNNIWFHGSNAMAANGGVRVKMYAPGTWNGGSSYSHLDYTTYNDTANELMVYAISTGESVHDPGPVATGLLMDLGWSHAVRDEDRIGVFRDGPWYLDYDGNGVWDGCGTDGCLSLGMAGDVTVVGDWNESGASKIGVYRSGTWFLDSNGNSVWDGCGTDGCLTFGMAGDVPVVGDWNGSGTSKIGAYRSGTWFLDSNGNSVWDGCGTDGCLTFGMAGDVPVVGDWNGSGTSKIGAYRSGTWFLDSNGNGAWDGCGTDGCLSFGMAGDVPVVGDWNGSGTSKIGVYRSGAWFLDSNGNSVWDGCGTDGCLSFGMAGDVPVVGLW